MSKVVRFLGKGLLITGGICVILWAAQYVDEECITEFMENVWDDYC